MKTFSKDAFEFREVIKELELGSWVDWWDLMA